MVLDRGKMKSSGPLPPYAAIFHDRGTGFPKMILLGPDAVFPRQSRLGQHWHVVYFVRERYPHLSGGSHVAAGASFRGCLLLPGMLRAPLDRVRPESPAEWMTT